MISESKLWNKATAPKRFRCFNGRSGSDPKFATAYDDLSAAYSNLGENSLAAENAKKAYELSGSLSEPEKLSVEAAYDAFVTGNLEKERQTLELWERVCPGILSRDLH